MMGNLRRAGPVASGDSQFHRTTAAAPAAHPLLRIATATSARQQPVVRQAIMSRRLAGVQAAEDGVQVISTARYPALYQVNTRVLLTALTSRLGRPATLDDIPDETIDAFAAQGFDWIWCLSVWQTGSAGQRVSRTHPGWQDEFRHTLPDLTEADIAGSGFAVTDYAVHAALGGEAALARLRSRLQLRGLRLMLDFVPNHVALDHPWAVSHPELLVTGTETDLQRQPQNYTRLAAGQIFAYGRDPYFDGWPDTLQLDYANPATQQAMREQLLRIAVQCDGIRCDMAMLVLPDVFERTWGRRPPPFWSQVIPEVRARVPHFTFMAEVYWDLEWRMHQEGFDYTYDKRLYDRLRDLHARPVREHLCAGLDYQERLVRFLENHDEPRAAATFTRPVHEAAAIITFLSPGLRFFHQGQFDGRVTRISPHLVRAPEEPVDDSLRAFYDRLLDVLRRPVVRDGRWRLLECTAAWDGNWTSDGFVAWTWDADGASPLVAVTNYAANQGQCYVRLPFDDFAGRTVRLTDLMSDAVYDRGGSEATSRGLYLDMPAWGYHVFTVAAI
jgi:glycosidase